MTTTTQAAPEATPKPSYLAKAIDRRKPKGLRVGVYSPEGQGKTSFAATAPNAVLLPTEDGTIGLSQDLDITVLPLIKTYEDMQGILREIAEVTKAEGKCPFDSIIIDSATAYERLVHDYVLRTDPKFIKGQYVTFEEAHGGFGKAYTVATQLFSKFFATLDWFIDRNVNIIITCHALPVIERDTIAGSEYTAMDCSLYSPRNAKQMGARECFKQWVDILGYIYSPVYVSGDDKFKTAMSAGTERYMGLHSNPKYAAKNRFAVQEPFVIPKENSWDALVQLIKSGGGVTQAAPMTYEPEALPLVAPAVDEFSDAMI